MSYDASRLAARAAFYGERCRRPRDVRRQALSRRDTSSMRLRGMNLGHPLNSAPCAPFAP
jgi:hypothetical protein